MQETLYLNNRKERLKYSGSSGNWSFVSTFVFVHVLHKSQLDKLCKWSGKWGTNYYLQR